MYNNVLVREATSETTSKQEGAFDWTFAWQELRREQGVDTKSVVSDARFVYCCITLCLNEPNYRCYTNLGGLRLLQLIVTICIKFVRSRQPDIISVMFRSLLWFYKNECKAQSNCIHDPTSRHYDFHYVYGCIFQYSKAVVTEETASVILHVMLIDETTDLLIEYWNWKNGLNKRRRLLTLYLKNKNRFGQLV